MTLACLDISSKKRCLERLFTYHLKAHTLSNKLVSKVFAQKKGGEVLTAQICVQISVVSGIVPPYIAYSLLYSLSGKAAATGGSKHKKLCFYLAKHVSTTS